MDQHIARHKTIKQTIKAAKTLLDKLEYQHLRPEAFAELQAELIKSPGEVLTYLELLQAAYLDYVKTNQIGFFEVTSEEWEELHARVSAMCANIQHVYKRNPAKLKFGK